MTIVAGGNRDQMLPQFKLFFISLQHGVKASLLCIGRPFENGERNMMNEKITREVITSIVFIAVRFCVEISM
ncbi:hypothetical protein O71_14316 [Pontibacter sp. BAB1700]|nr:hypothetical protein O71_14316 [Pontibacter sp. BAB1700]